MSKLGEVLEGRNWDVAMLARKTDMSAIDVAEYVNGVTPPAEKAAIIADELGFEVGELFGGPVGPVGEVGPGPCPAGLSAEEAIEKAIIEDDSVPVEPPEEPTSEVLECKVPASDIVETPVESGMELKCRMVKDRFGNEYPGYDFRRGEHCIIKTGIVIDEVVDMIVVSNPDLALNCQIGAETCPIIIDGELCVALYRHGVSIPGSSDRYVVNAGDVVATLK